MSTQTRREDCRHEVLAYLVERQKLAYDATTIHRRLSRVSDLTVEEIEAAAEFLASAGLATNEPDPLGSTPYYKATASGILAQERGRV